MEMEIHDYSLNPKPRGSQGEKKKGKKTLGHHVPWQPLPALEVGRVGPRREEVGKKMASREVHGSGGGQV